MTTGKALNGKPYAGNPHVRFDEGEVASCTAEASLRRVHCRRQPEGRASVCAATSRRGSLLYTTKATRLALCAAVIGVAACASAAISPPARLVSDPANSLQWRTYCAGGDGIRWSWPDGALSAKLTVAGKSGAAEHVFAPGVDKFVPVLPAVEGDEDVVDLTLEFYVSENASGEPMDGKTLNAEGIGIVRGVNASEGVLRTSEAGGRQWCRIKDSSAVLPVPEGTTSLTIDGTERAPAELPGWCLWAPIAADPAAALSLTSPSGTFESVLKCGLFGVLLYVR